jgi:hypothetical protein
LDAPTPAFTDHRGIGAPLITFLIGPVGLVGIKLP